MGIYGMNNITYEPKKHLDNMAAGPALMDGRYMGRMHSDT